MSSYGIPPPMHHHYHYHYNFHIVNQTANANHGIRNQDLTHVQEANYPVTEQNMFVYHYSVVPPHQPIVVNGQPNVVIDEHGLELSYIHYYFHFHYNLGVDVNPRFLRTQPSLGVLVTIENRFNNVPQTHSHVHQHYPIRDLQVFGDSDEDD